MSEYQYYEFQALDRTLSNEDMCWLRRLSTRAQITATSFTNVYHWGDFGGNPITLMERCFDAFVYVTNWGYRQFMVRLPRESFNAAYAKQYCREFGVSVLKKKTCVLLNFDCDEEPGERDDCDDGVGWMASLTPLRDGLLDGDWRCLYLGWLAAVQTGHLPDDDMEPPVPAGLKDLTAPLGALVDYLGIDAELVEVAAERSGPRAANEPSASDWQDWIRALSATEKDEWLLKIVQGEEPHLRRSLLHRLREVAPKYHAPPSDDGNTPARTVAELTAVWQGRLEATRQRLAEQAAKERERRAHAEARARKAHLEDIASRTPAVWKEVRDWIAGRTPKGYDCAVELLVDLKDVATLANRRKEFDQQLGQLRSQHAGKPSLMRRLRDAGLAG